MKKVLTYLGVGFVIFFIAFNPDGAAAVAESLGGVIADVARGFGTFFTKLAT